MHLCHWIAIRWEAFAYLVSVWQPQRTERLPKCELAIWNNGLSTWRVRDWVTRRPVFPGSHNSLSNNLKFMKADRRNRADRSALSLARARARTLHFFSSHTARDQFSVLKYTHSSPNVCRVSHVNTVGYGLNERITGGWKLNACQYYMHTFRLKGTAFLNKYLSVSSMLANKRC